MTVFEHISEHLGAPQYYSAMRRIFNSFFGVWKRAKTWSVVFNILLKFPYMADIFWSI